MSIQTELNRINTAVSKQTNLLAQIQTALEGKGSGGGGGYQVSIGVAEYDGYSISPMSGIDFEPKFVVVFLPNATIIHAEEYAEDGLFISACEGTFNGETYSFRVGLEKTMVSGRYDVVPYSGSGITFYDDGSGFELILDGMIPPESSGEIGGFRYMYIAIG